MYILDKSQTKVNSLTIDYCLKVGGVVTDLGPDEGAGPVLSTAHIWPQGLQDKPRAAFWLGAGLIHVSRANTSIVKNNHSWGYRGLASFSAASRRRLMRKIATVDRSNKPLFVTLTYPDNFPHDPEVYKRHFNLFTKRFHRAFPDAGFIWKLEFQDRGAAHFHILVWGCLLGALRGFVPGAWAEVVGSDDRKHYLWHVGALGNGNKHCVQEVYSYRQVASYASKYMSKAEVGVVGVGRWWGVRYPDNIPWGAMVICQLPSERAVSDLYRLMRRYMQRTIIDKNGKFIYQKKVRARDYPSLYLMCDADRWFQCLDDIVMQS